MKEVFRFHHPLHPERVLTLELPADTLLRDVTALLYEQGFVAPKRGGYQYLIDGRLAAGVLSAGAPQRRNGCLRPQPADFVRGEPR